MTSYAYSSPLVWPTEVARHEGERVWGPFMRVQSSSIIGDLEDTLRKLGATNIAITSHATVLRNGRPSADDLTKRMRDPGVAIYLRRGTRDLVFALDRFTTPKDNLRGITLAIEGLRSVERYGGPGMEDRAFSGFAALPAQAGEAHWSVVLGLAAEHEFATKSAKRPTARAELLELAERSYRELAKTHHPDRGGSHEAFVELGRALEQARKELGRG